MALPVICWHYNESLGEEFEAAQLGLGIATSLRLSRKSYLLSA
jgi:hypothetical protein